MKKFLKQIGLFIIPALIGVLILFIIPANKQFSYRFVQGECSNKASWIYDRIFFSEFDLDLIFIGASQTACAIMDHQIEHDLQEITGKSVKVANLGYCRGGRDIQYIMLKEVFRHKKPSVVVIEVTEDEPKKSHPVFPYLAESRDLLGSLVFFNQRYFQSLFKGLIVRFEYLKWILFGNSNPAPNNMADHGYINTSVIADEELFNQNRLNWDKRMQRNKPGFLRDIEVRYSKHYLEKMVKLANDNGSKVEFLFLRESGSNLEKPILYDYYQTLSNMNILPGSIYSDPANWSDATHFNDSGATKASSHIAFELSQKISNRDW
jgi:hypothetical protein